MNLKQITVPSLDLKKSVAFYKTLGLKQIIDNLPTYARFESPNGEAKFRCTLPIRFRLATAFGFISSATISMRRSIEATTEEIPNVDLESMDRDELLAEVKKLRNGIREHCDCTGHNLC